MADSKVHVEDIVYKGKTVEATVPDTLDLAERAGLALNCLTQVVDPDYGYTPYIYCNLFSDPPVLILLDWNTACDPKIVEALPMLRLMSGSDFNADLDARMMEALANRVGDDGLHWSRHLVYPQREKPWPRLGPHLMTGIDSVPIGGSGRLMRAMKWWRQMDDNLAVC